MRDAAAVLDVVAGGDDRDRSSLPRELGSFLKMCDGDVRGLNVAWTPDLGYAAVDPKVLAACENAAGVFETLGCHVEVVNPGWENPEEIFATIIAAQFYAAWSDRLPDAEPHMDASLVRFIRRGGAVATRDYLRAVARVEEYWREAQTFLERFDVLLMPTVATLPFAAGAHPPREIAGPVPVQPDGPARGERAGRMDRRGPSGRPADRRASPCRRHRAGGVGRVRNRFALERSSSGHVRPRTAPDD